MKYTIEVGFYDWNSEHILVEADNLAEAKKLALE
jgi:hypothetical protein